MIPVVTAALGLGTKLIERIFPDPEQQAQAKIALLDMEQRGELEELKGAVQIITAEASSEHAITAQWRPITMLVFVFIIANNYIVAPYIMLFFDVTVSLEIPPDMWDLLKIGLGGYVVGRSSEKAVKMWKAK